MERQLSATKGEEACEQSMAAGDCFQVQRKPNGTEGPEGITYLALHRMQQHCEVVENSA